VLVVAKAPVPGLAKTRLANTFGPEGAAELAAAALLDTLAAVGATDVASRIVALTGDLASARRSEEIGALLAGFTVIPQRGDTFAERLCAAHADAAALAAGPVLQIGMDTPQVTPGLLGDALAALIRPGVDAVLGPATDGGWWALGLTRPQQARALLDVPLSRSDTGDNTLVALRRAGSAVSGLPALTDVDTVEEVGEVAALVGADSHFRRAVDRFSPPPGPGADGHPSATRW
jgi:glycosyltransferase A (GT-A) superfamily protein (DUF2064 family)